MGGCFSWLLILAGAIFIMISLLRWFEQTSEAVDQSWWNKVALLVAFPIAVWFFPSKVATGRPMPVPRHEPVRGFGGLPKGGIEDPKPEEPTGPAPATARSDTPPPGTPKEFLGMPKIPDKPVKKQAIDPEKLAKLRQKMRDQGMLDE
jgi:hypothetical protein